MKDCIDLILNHAESCPDHPCVIEAAGQVSYAQFMVDVRTIANFLKANNHKKILLNMSQGHEAYAAIIATLLVGGYYCPLNLDSPEERKIYVVKEFDPDVVITDRRFLLPNDKIGNYRQIAVDEIRSISSSPPLAETLRCQNPHELSYVIYTSGSTGNPKGVMIRRTALNKFLEWSLNAYKCTTNDKWAQYSSLSFDLSVVDIFTTLCAGATLVPLSDMGQKLRPANTIAKHRITVWHSVPGAVDFMIENEKSRSADLSSLRLVSFCGEPLYEYHLDYLFSKNPNLIVFNTYGPTEGTLFCTWIKLDASNYKHYNDTNISIGTAIPGWNLLLRDGNDRTKSLIIHGDYLGKGYLNLQSKAFFNEEIDGQNQCCYDTGDVVKEVNSNLYFVGRGDNQVKLRGFRIELDEIDNWVMKFTQSKSVSIVYNDAIHTFVEANEVDEGQLRKSLEGQIERYKVPAYIYALRPLPRNSNQKINRLELKNIIDAKGKVDVTV
jgi:D-alanine--poly(phosphoribitol) ligase subunit 1